MKNFTTIVAAALLLTACSKTVKEVSSKKDSTADSSSFKSVDSDVEAIKKLVNSRNPNLALAQLLMKTLATSNKNEVNRLILSLTATEALSIINKVAAENKLVRSYYLYHGESYQYNDDFLNNSHLSNIGPFNHTMSLEGQLSMTTFAYIKSKSLDSIISTYDKRASDLAKDLAETIAVEIGTKSPELAAEIEKNLHNSNKVIDLIRKSKPMLEKVDHYFKNSELNEDEQYTVVLTGIVAAAVYECVSANQGFKKVITEATKVIRDAKELNDKAHEFAALVTTLKTHFEESKREASDLRDGISGSYQDVKVMVEKIGKGPSDIHSRRIIDFLYKRVISGEKATLDVPDSNIMTKSISFGDNFNKTIISAKKMSNNLSSILQTSERIASIFGVKPSKGVKDVLDAANKVSSVLSTVQSVTAGFAMGGYIGAVAALGSSPMMSMMGGGSADAALLDEINRKLDIVIEQQQKIMEMQVETMNMIKELALMIDTYHEQEMAALSELKDYSMVNLEIGRMTINQDIRACDDIIMLQLKSHYPVLGFNPDNFSNIYSFDVLKTQFVSSIHGINDIKNLINSVNYNGFNDCQKGIVKAFGAVGVAENPVLSIFMTTEFNNLYAFNRNTYKPLLNTMRTLTGSEHFDNVPLHIPVKAMKDLTLKKDYIDGARFVNNPGKVFALDELVSTKSLERYLSRLLILHPILELDKAEWSKDIGTIVSNYLGRTEGNRYSRAQYFMESALKLTQTAIAQESILAGEPILHLLYTKFLDDVFSGQLVQENEGPNAESIIGIRNNSLLLTNLLMYSLYVQGEGSDDFMASYEKAYDLKDVVALSKLLNLGKEPIAVKILKPNEDDSVTFVVDVPLTKEKNVSVKLPTPDELSEGTILYSPNLSRLLKMQELILNSLEEVSPVERDENILKMMAEI